MRWRSVGGLIRLAAIMVGSGSTLSAQAPVAPPPSAAQAPADSVRAPVGALPAFFRSLLLPGWGQAVLDRKLTGGLFLLWEGVTLSMTWKAHREVQYLRRTEASRVDPEALIESPLLRAKKAEREDWLVLLIFNHLFSGLEAYVGAHLWDFPGDVRLRALPPNHPAGPGLGVSIPIRIR